MITARHIAALQILCLWLVGGAMLCACNASPPKESPKIVAHPAVTPAVEPTASASVTAAKKTQTAAGAATQAANNVTPENFATTFPTLVAAVKTAWAAAGDAVAAAVAVVTPARNKDAEAAQAQKAIDVGNKNSIDTTDQLNKANAKNAELQTKIDGMYSSLGYWALGAGLIGSFGLSVLGVYLCIKVDLMNGLAALGAGIFGMILSIVAMMFQDFVTEYKLPLGIGITVFGIGATAFIAYLAYRKLHESAVTAAKVIQTGIVTGAIDGAEFSKIAKANETPQFAAIVDKNTDKDARTKAAADALKGGG